MFAKYIKKSKLGNGSYGSVYSVVRISDNTIFACKEVKLNETFGYHNYNEIIAREFLHPNIIKIFDIYVENRTMYIVMEKWGKSLYHYLSKGVDLGNKKNKIFQQIIEGLMYLYGQGYVHADLSMGNIMIHNDQIKLIDFGLMYRRSLDKKPSIVGVTQYVQPPELICKKMFDVTKIDTWSLGIIYHYLTFGYHLLHIEKELDEKDLYYSIGLLTMVGRPDTSLLKKYGLDEYYINCALELGESQTLDDALDNLISYYDKTWTIVKWKDESRSVKFIKKMLNWNYKKRPNIVDCYKIFRSYFLTNAISSPALVKILWLNNIINNRKKNTCYSSECIKYEIHDTYFKYHLKIANPVVSYSGLIDAVLLNIIIYHFSLTGDKKVNKKLFLRMSKYFNLTHGLINLIKYHKKNVYNYEENAMIIQYSGFYLDVSKYNVYEYYQAVSKNKEYDKEFMCFYYMAVGSPCLFHFEKDEIFSGLMLIIWSCYDVGLKNKLINDFNGIGDEETYIIERDTYFTQEKYISCALIILRIIKELGDYRVKILEQFSLTKKWIIHLEDLLVRRD